MAKSGGRHLIKDRYSYNVLFLLIKTYDGSKLRRVLPPVLDQQLQISSPQHELLCTFRFDLYTVTKDQKVSDLCLQAAEHDMSL